MHIPQCVSRARGTVRYNAYPVPGARVNAARARNNAARYLDITEMTKDTVVDFSAMMSVAILKRSRRPTR